MGNLLNKTLFTRTLSGVVLFIVVVGSIWLSPYMVLALLSAICIGSMMEFYKLATVAGAKPLDSYPTIIGVLTIWLAFVVKLGHFSPLALFAIIPAVFMIFIIELYRKGDTPFANIGWGVTGYLYIALPLALLAYFPVQGASNGYIVYRPLMILSVIFIVWANDIGAYLFGVVFGRHRLFERHSPKKSWEGFIGGVVCAVAVGVIMSHFQSASKVFWGGAAFVISVSGVYGDLVESMLKRSVGVKDSGNIMPGHGGFLDRFDALFFAMPYLFIYFIIFA